MNEDKITFGCSYKIFTYETIRENLLQFNRENYPLNETDTYWNIMFNIIKNIIGRICPVKEFSFSKKKRDQSGYQMT